MVTKTPAQSPRAGWRNRRMLGYQGLSARSMKKRQSGAYFSATQTGRASAPARCASEVSQVITRSERLHHRGRVHKGIRS